MQDGGSGRLHHARLARFRRHARGRVAAVLATALLAASCSSGSDTARPTPPLAAPATASPTPSVGSSPTAPAAELARYYGQRPRWAGCEGRFQCTNVSVPVDYRNPDSGDLSLSVIRLPASDKAHRIGSLLLNPGGPGGSGIDYARAARAVTSDELRRRFDIVGFDPRGVGESTPIRCLTDRQTDAAIAADGSPDTASEVAVAAAGARLLGEQCDARNGPLLAHVSTRDAARDMDVLRALLGDEKMHYLGKSYGTFLGATYAELFPQRVAAMVLDGAIDPQLPADAIDEAQAKGFEVALRAFVADCLKQKDCSLPGPVDAGLDAVDALLERIDAHPLASDQKRTVTQGLAVLGVVASLYDQDSGWPVLRQGLAEAERGEGSTLLAVADYYTDRQDDGIYSTNANDVIYAVNCLDRPAPADGVAHAKEKAAQFAREAPRFGRYLAWSSLPCSTWPVPATGRPHAIAAVGAAPILVVGTTRDPATPYAWAKSLSEELASGVLLSVNGDGHTAYERGSACVDKAVDAYLLGRKVPADGTRCG